MSTGRILKQRLFEERGSSSTIYQDQQDTNVPVPPKLKPLQNSCDTKQTMLNLHPASSLIITRFIGIHSEGRSIYLPQSIAVLEWKRTATKIGSSFAYLRVELQLNMQEQISWRLK